jgi:CBS domain-containing protein
MTDDADLSALTGAGAPILTYASDEIVVLDASASVREAARLIDSASVGCIVVGSAEAVEGVVTERDVVRLIAAGRDPDTVTVGDLESRILRWATPDATVGEVAEEMMEEYVRHVLVGDDGRLVGIVSMRDLLGAYLS